MVPELNGCRLVSPNHDPHLSIVGDLLCFEPMSWNSMLVDQTFLPWEAEYKEYLTYLYYS